MEDAGLLRKATVPMPPVYTFMDTGNNYRKDRYRTDSCFHR